MDNNSYSVKENAGKSIRTFLLTLSISLIVFSAVYYVLTTNISKNESFESQTTQTAPSEESVSVSQPAEEVAAATDEGTVFGKLAQKDPGVQSAVVLSGSTVGTSQTTSSGTTTPDTGTFGLTVGLFLALTLFLASMILVSKNPRKLALSEFEKNATKD